ncbi:MAG: hypothetical protein JNM83_23535 [Myxococcales bacterium]|nr:hypothetical protein [Myxococcales bacterium]
MTTSLALRLRTLFSLLRQRADLHFDQFTTGSGEVPSVMDQIHWDARIPDDLRQFSRELPTLTCSYQGKGLTHEESPISGGIELTTLAGPGELSKPEWVPAVDGAVPSVDSWIFLDVPECWNGECTTFALLPDRSELLYLYENTTRFASLTDYLTLGAKRAFVAYWPELNAQLGNTPAQQLAVLRQHSLPEGTSEGVLHKRLRSAGLSDELASDLQEWLGSDLTLYFTR